jgi:hypothetical protein
MFPATEDSFRRFRFSPSADQYVCTRGGCNWSGPLDQIVGGENCLQIHQRPSINATLTGYAYETIAGKLIRAGQISDTVYDPTNDSGPSDSLSAPTSDAPGPASLGVPALVAQSVPLGRRKESIPEGK